MNEVRKMLTRGDTHDVDTQVTPTLRTRSRSADLDDAKVDVKVVLSGLWISMLFVFAYVDIFGFWRADVINGALTGTVPGAGFTINQSFLVFTTIYVLIPSLMLIFSLVAPVRINRTANIVVSLLYAVSVVVSAVGETWTYYVLGSVFEVLLLLNIARVAWTWPRHPESERSTDV
jgi:hypothetical protein